MIKVYNRDIKETVDALRREFKGCKFIMKIDPEEDSGYLIGVSSDPSTFSELRKLPKEYAITGPFGIFGSYDLMEVINVQCETQYPQIYS